MSENNDEQTSDSSAAGGNAFVETAQSSATNDSITAEVTAESTTDTSETTQSEPLLDINKMGILNDVSITLSIEIGRSQIKIRDLLKLTKGAIIELDKLAGEPVDVYANGKLISKGNIITANGKYCVRLTSVSEKNKKGVEQDGK